MKPLKMVKLRITKNWLDFLTGSYLILTLILGLYSFFRLPNPTSIAILLIEIAYLGVGLILTIVILIWLNLFLIKLKRANFKLSPLKIQLHSFNLWAIILWTALICLYGIQSAWAIFSSSPPIIPSFLGNNLFSHLITIQFSLTIYLLMSMLVIFIYALVLHKHKNLTIKIFPDHFWMLDTASWSMKISLETEWLIPLFALLEYCEFYFYQLWNQLVVLALKLKYLKTLALRQFKKETTPPSYLYLFN